MTPEQIFTDFVKHLSKQNCPSKAQCDGECLYRTNESSHTFKCAAGMFIPDDMYSPNMEGKSIKDLMAHAHDHLPAVILNNPDLIAELQNFHDTRLPGSIEKPWNTKDRTEVRRLLLELADGLELPRQPVLDHFTDREPT